MRVSRSDPREAALVKMLRVAEPELAESDETLVIPVIGRGRAVSALPASKIDGERIGAFAEFVTGQCSCEVKDLNPGIDLLMTANWDVIFEDGGAAALATDPPVEPAGKLVPIAPAIASKAADVAIVNSAPPAMSSPVAPVANIPSPSVDAHRKWLIAAIALTAAIALFTGIALLRRRT
jgi:hypothetical protein